MDKSLFLQNFINNSQFRFVNFTDVVFRNCTFKDCIFAACGLHRVEFEQCEFLNTTIKNTISVDVSFVDCTSKYLSILKSKLTSFSVENCDMPETFFDECVLRKTVFEGVKLKSNRDCENVV